MTKGMEITMTIIMLMPAMEMKLDNVISRTEDRQTNQQTDQQTKKNVRYGVASQRRMGLNFPPFRQNRATKSC